MNKKKEIKKENKDVQVSIRIPEELKTEIDINCAQNKTTIKDFAIEAFNDKLSK